jgi:hypothetical protein
MTTLTLVPGRRYKSTGATTAAKAVGSTDLSQLQVSNVGAAVALADGTEVVVSAPLTVTFTGETLQPTAGQFSLVTAATAALRRILATSTTTSAPTLSTQGYSLQGAGLTIIDITTAGAMTWQLWTYSATSELWQLDTSIGTAGSVAFGGAGQSRTEVDLRGLDRMAVVITVNGGSSAISAWATGIPVDLS